MTVRDILIYPQHKAELRRKSVPVKRYTLISLGVGILIAIVIVVSKG